MKVSKVNALVKNIQYAQDHIDQEALILFYKKKMLNIFESMLDSSFKFFPEIYATY